jgi:hypothetical protein
MVRNMSINRISTADVSIDLADAFDAAIDFAAPVTVTTVDHAPDKVFLGRVTGATLDGTWLRVHLSSAPEFEESMLGGLGIHGIDPREVVHALATAIGWSPEAIKIEGLTEPRMEVFEVIVPLDGVELRGPTRVGNVRILQTREVKRLAHDLGPPRLVQDFERAQAWVVALISARHVLDAERGGIQRIQEAIAWLNTLVHYSSVALPSGRLVDFRRNQLLNRCTVKSVVLVRGLSSRRRWLRSPDLASTRPSIALDLMRQVLAVKAPAGDPRFGEAVLAWRRALDIEDPIGQVTALWEAIEFYVASTSLPPVFETAEIKGVLRRASEGLTQEQRRRLDDVMSGLNNPPLLPRLKFRLQEDGVPINDAEIEILRRIRTVRNRFQHGESREWPDADDLSYSAALVNRMLVYASVKRYGNDLKPGALPWSSAGAS